MKKKQLKQDEISWQKVKLIEGGGKGIELKYSYIFEVDGKGYMKTLPVTCDLPPHDELIKKIQGLRIIVAKIENIDYARRLLSMPGFEPTKIQMELTEATVQESMKQIEVTGINLSERRKEKGVIISYKKSDLNDHITGHKTTWISVSNGEMYGIEEELEEIINEIKSEAFQYEFEEKYADFEQLSLFNNRKKDDSGIEDAEEVK